MSVIQVIIDRSSSMVIGGTHDYERDCYGILLPPRGPSFPSTPATGEIFLRTDLNEFYYYNGSAWIVLTASIDGYLTVQEHKSLHHLIHFIDDGPAGGFASGAYKETLPLGNPFPTSMIWWVSSAKTKKIVELLITRGSGQRPITEVWKMYDTDGTTVLETVTDSISYSGSFETTRVRTIA